MDIRYGRDLIPGDLIGVCYNNYIWLAIYAGQGSVDNTNFYLLCQVINSKNRGVKRIYKGFINRHDRPNSSPIVKIAVDQLTNEQDQLDYLEAKNYLNQIGAI